MEPREVLLAKKRQRLLRLKRAISYQGPDPGLQEAALVALTQVLGYRADEPHRKIIRHQNQTAYGPRDEDLTLGFRGMGKSTVGTVVRAVKYAIDDPNVRILLASDGSKAAERFLDEIVSHLRFNEDLIAMFGTFFGRHQAKSYFDEDKRGRFRDGSATILQRRDPTISEPTFFCIGVGGQSASHHFDVIFKDDLVTIRNSKTPVQRRNLEDWHGSTLVGCEVPETKSHNLGTRYYPHDLNQWLEDGSVDESEGALAGAVLKIPAILVDSAGVERSQYPERYTLERLHRMAKKMGRYHFAAQMQQDTDSGEGIIFNWSDFQWYSERPRRKDLSIFQFSDLAAKKTDTGAFFACVTIGVSQDKERIYVLDMIHERCGMKRQREHILAASAKWKALQSGVEAVAMQAGFAEEIQAATLLPVIPVPVEGDKVFRARRVQHLFEAHKIYFPLDDQPNYKAIRPMLEELTVFPDGEFMDTVDAIVGALTLAMLGGPAAASPDYDEHQDDTYLRATY